MIGVGPERAEEIARRVEPFVRETIIPYEQDGRKDRHRPSTSLRGTASSAQAIKRVAVLPELMALAWAQAVKAGA